MNYNGFTNYATWRIYLEVFSDVVFKIYDWDRTDIDADFCENYAYEVIFKKIPESLAKNYAYAFFSQVDWHEISKHLNEE